MPGLPFQGVYPDPGLFSGAVGGAPGVPAPGAQEARPDNPISPAPPAEEQPPPQVQPFEGSIDNSNPEEDVDAAVNDAAARNRFYGGLYGGGAGAGGAVMPEGSDYLGVGGPEGAQNVYDAFVAGPKELTKAVRAGGEAQAEESRQMADVYAHERDRTRDYEAALKEQYQLRANEMQARQAELEKYTQTYTNNLADQGAFWHNPQNVLAAMAASLMNLATDDRSLPVKMLNGAIQQDLAHRRALAEGHLGQLRSNMAEYDKIAGDKIGGMQLAEAEAKRVAANELQRIAAQFQGPKAKANAEFISNQLMRESMLGYMDFYRTRLYNKPQIVDPRILKEYQKGGQAFPNAGWTPYSQFPGAAGPEGAPMPARPGTAPGPGAAGPGTGGPTSLSSPAIQPGSRITLTPEERAAYNKRYPGGARLVEAGLMRTEERAYMAAGVPPGTPASKMTAAQIKAFNASKKEQENATNEYLSKVSAQAQKSADRNAGLRTIQDDMALLEQAAKQSGQSVDDLVSTKGRIIIGGPTWVKADRAWDAIGGLHPEERNKYEQFKAETKRAGERVMQLMAGEISDYYQKQSGSAVTSNELPRLEMYVSASSPYGVLRNFVDNESTKAQGEVRTVLGQLPPDAAALWLMKVSGGKQTKLKTTSINPPRKPEPAERAAPLGKNHGPKPKEQ